MLEDISTSFLFMANIPLYGLAVDSHFFLIVLFSKVLVNTTKFTNSELLLLGGIIELALASGCSYFIN